MNLKSELQNYGVTSRNFRLFGDTASLELLDYLDLVESRVPDEFLPNGVVENQGRPLLFIVNESRLIQMPKEQEQQIKTLRRKLACRGDRAYLARIEPGKLSVIPVSLDEQMPNWKVYTRGTPEALTFFTRLAHGHYDGEGEPKEADYVFSAMFELVWSVADRLAALKLKRADVLSLMGRALFFRFLRDRHVVQDEDGYVQRIAPKATSILECFANADNAASTSTWLDETFNGDLLPLIEGDFHELGRRTGGMVFVHLTAIVKGEEPVGDKNYQLPLPIHFGHFFFDHIPVGLLSQVYERFAWKWEHQTAKETSVHYTPRNIAATLVDEAFTKLPDAEKARVLDPACGAGVFLVLAFRRLYRERWRADGERPDKKVIRKILEKQLVGFDISDSALKLAALSLYLTAIELDPEPEPPEKLGFKKLQDSVLFNFRREGVDPAEGAVAGSLAAHVGQKFDGQFDLVVSNPPWTSLKPKERPLAEELNRLSKAIIKRHGHEKLASKYQNPDFAPDLPFVWKTTEWCKPNGRIAMALPARILLKQEAIPKNARETLFQLVEVTGIINGSNLSDTKVWPDMMQPFMLFFARNRSPKTRPVVRLITPHCDTVLNRNGETRIDSKSVQPVEINATFEEAWLWKALAVGTPLDVEVTRKIKQAIGKPLDRYWKKELRLASGKGYQIVESQKPSSAKFLKGLPNLDSTNAFRFLVKADELLPFKRDTASRPRKKAIYEAPLVLVKEAPGIDRTLGWALLSFDKIAYNESFCGYSAAGHKDGELLVRYLQLFVHSSVWLHYALMTSAKFGAERRRFYKADLDECPIIPLDKLSDEQRRDVSNLSQRLVAGDLNVFGEIDAFFGKLYGLNKLDLEVIRDTLEVCLPYDESRERACHVPAVVAREIFRRRLESVLHPFFKVLGKEPQVVVWRPDEDFLRKKAPFGIVLIGEQGRVLAKPDSLFRDFILELADDAGATKIVQQVGNGLLIGILNQYRYWTPSRARLLGAEIVRQHMNIFEE